MARPGSIYKVTVKNFVTYTYSELVPGPNLNMLLGPNGTGKSTIVAAIILGLGGNPKTVGRGTKISEYVKHYCDEAEIEIQLHGHQQNELILINRHFNTSDKTVWKLNGNVVSFKEIGNTIKQFNIQVDNLCQFLPQDRVQEFAKLNKQQLLQQMQIAICRDDLINKQLNLIKIYNRYKEIQGSTEKTIQKLQELIDANARIEERVKNLKKKNRYLKCIEEIDRKIAWLQYEELRIKMDTIHEERNQANHIFNKYKDAAKPIESRINIAKETISNIEQAISKKNQEVRKRESLVQTKLDRYKNMKASITNILNETNYKINQIEQKNKEILQNRELVNELNNQRVVIFQNYGDEELRRNKVKKLNLDYQDLSRSMENVMAQRGGIETAKINESYNLKSLENQLQGLENIRLQRLERLRRLNSHAYEAVVWLRENKNLFQQEVFEPMMLEINVLNPSHAKFVENLIALRDKIAFTCVSKQDMKTLIRLLHDQRKLKINVFYSGNEGRSLQSYHPQIPIEQLRQYGFFAYVRSLITAPEPILKYLCKNYKIHNIPVGDATVLKYYDSLPPGITAFFSDTFRFTTSYSKFTKQKAFKQIEIKTDGSLSISMNAERMENIRGQVIETRNDLRKYDAELQSLQAQITQINEKQSIIANTLKEVQRFKQQVNGIDTRIKIAQARLEQLQQTSTKEQVQTNCDAQIKRIVEEMVKCQTEIKHLYVQYSNILNESELDNSNLTTAREQVVFLENKSRDVRQAHGEAESRLNRIKEVYANAKQVAKEALAKAKQLSNNFTPEDGGFYKFRAAYDSLPDNLKELHIEREHISSRNDCLNSANIEEQQEFEQREEQIVNLRSVILNENSELDRINSNIDLLQNEWIEPLQEIVEEINKKFSASFKQMGCAGDISISKGNHEKDFSEYGLSIKVKYRDAQPLQELNSVIQSGGEKAVATAAFMLSLQELTPVPFRCVDEINQGMDPNNERRIFDLLVDTTSRSNTSQYFFITPKLLSDLRYNKMIKCHVVCNGPLGVSQIKWKRVMEGGQNSNRLQYV